MSSRQKSWRNFGLFVLIFIQIYVLAHLYCSNFDAEWSKETNRTNSSISAWTIMGRNQEDILTLIKDWQMFVFWFFLFNETLIHGRKETIFFGNRGKVFTNLRNFIVVVCCEHHNYHSWTNKNGFHIPKENHMKHS